MSIWSVAGMRVTQHAFADGLGECQHLHLRQIRPPLRLAMLHTLIIAHSPPLVLAIK
ncbi:hypothetical protein N9D23_12305 [Rubripirellula sp.]|nr:hypothetical protein [Rubripirellula sp.]MDF1842652.1 hypothetical protein [Rubripirellula sp.]